MPTGITILNLHYKFWFHIIAKLCILHPHQKVTYMHVFQSTHRRVLGFFFLQQQKIVITVIWQKFREIQKYKSISRNFLPLLLPEFFFHFFSGALWCVTWWRRKYHLFFTVLLHLSHRTSPPIVCIFKICCKIVIYLVLIILKIKQLNLYRKKG